MISQETKIQEKTRRSLKKLKNLEFEHIIDTCRSYKVIPIYNVILYLNLCCYTSY